MDGLIRSAELSDKLVTQLKMPEQIREIEGYAAEQVEREELRSIAREEALKKRQNEPISTNLRNLERKP
ncbi:hypothetical protein RLOatenuis_2140 [Rickettsiales bacterium]|nr:hypothetical protein RLOatenuis_2140 [Rickettsiales bacterium]